MSFSIKEIAQYADLANQYLENIPIEKLEDFEAVKEALKSITDPSNVHHVAPSLAGRVTSIKEIIDQPEMYVEQAVKYKAFKGIILQRITGKIKEIESLSLVEKERYIAEQKSRKEKIAQDHAEMSTHQPPAPGSEARTLTHEQWLREEQQRFRNEGAPAIGEQLEQLLIDQVMRLLRPVPINSLPARWFQGNEGNQPGLVGAANFLRALDEEPMVFINIHREEESSDDEDLDITAHLPRNRPPLELSNEMEMEIEEQREIDLNDLPPLEVDEEQLRFQQQQRAARHDLLRQSLVQLNNRIAEEGYLSFEDRRMQAILETELQRIEREREELGELDFSDLPPLEEADE